MKPIAQINADTAAFNAQLDALEESLRRCSEIEARMAAEHIAFARDLQTIIKEALS